MKCYKMELLGPCDCRKQMKKIGILLGLPG